MERESGGGPASSPKKAWKNRCAVAGSETVAAIAAHLSSESGSATPVEKKDRSFWTAMLKAKVAKRTWTARRGSRRRTAPPIAKLTTAATSADRVWVFKTLAVYSLCRRGFALLA